MKATGAIQIAIILLLVASAASCEVAKEYSTRVFKPTTPPKKTDSSLTALRFMEFDSDNASDSIDLKGFATKEINGQTQAMIPQDSVKNEVVVVEPKPIQKGEPIDATKRGSARTRKIRQ